MRASQERPKNNCADKNDRSLHDTPVKIRYWALMRLFCGV
jgi:hypothetical protein